MYKLYKLNNLLILSQDYSSKLGKRSNSELPTEFNYHNFMQNVQQQVYSYYLMAKKVWTEEIRSNLKNKLIIILNHDFNCNVIFTFSSEKVLDLCKMWTPPRFCQMFTL